MKDIFAIGAIAFLSKYDIVEHAVDSFFELPCSEDNLLDILFGLEIFFPLNHYIPFKISYSETLFIILTIN